jgi:1-acyl-sn-glycerol-3-phosphate acyltransferase
LTITLGALRFVLAPIMNIGFRLTVVGGDFLPAAGAAIVIGNHASFLDPFLISARCRRPVRWLVSQEFYAKRQLRWLLSWFGTIPVGGGRSMVRSYRRIAEVVSGGGLVGIFPEGGITRDGELKPFRDGAAVIAFRLGVPVVPLHIHGTYEALPRYAKWPRFVPVTIRIGEPIRVRQTQAPTPDEIALLTAAMRAAVLDLEAASRAALR